ncbi:TetR family transcriptional regulator [candidate division GN15 bacterium]|nr:TetR family transcriptional regulator [candidate division GN15 bacterium]
MASSDHIREDGKRQPDAEAPTKRRILDAARTEFAEHGKAGGRVDRIASAAGINKAMIYYHFSSKDGLYMEVIRDFYNRVSSLVVERTSEEDTIEGVLSAMSTSYVEFFDQHQSFRPILLRVLAEEGEDTFRQVAEIFVKSGLLKRIFDVIQRSKTEGHLRDVVIEQAMVSFVTMNVGYIIMAPVVDQLLGITDRKAFLEQRKHAVVDVFLHGILKR